MKRLETKWLSIGGKEYPFRFSVLSFMLYSEQFDKEITQCKTFADQLRYYYCAYQAGCEYEKVEKKISDLNDWLILIDDYPDVLKQMGTALADATSKKK